MCLSSQNAFPAFNLLGNFLRRRTARVGRFCCECKFPKVVDQSWAGCRTCADLDAISLPRYVYPFLAMTQLASTAQTSQPLSPSSTNGRTLDPQSLDVLFLQAAGLL
jgi:hypothetical protein